jgi:uncharacterized membrane protein YraQ (UPF0718 family)
MVVAILTRFADWFTYVLLQMSQGTLLSGAVHFFVYDVVKIYLLLVVVVFVISLVQTWLPAEKIKRVLMHHYEFFGSVLAALNGKWSFYGGISNDLFFDRLRRCVLSFPYPK